MKILLALPVLAAAALAAVALAAPAPGRGTATITTAGGANVVLRVEIADSADEWRRGLMHRRSLAPKAGMVFAFPSDVRGGFWMKNTLIPLDIAYVDRSGRIVRILTMTPCRREPCKVYDPGRYYRRALEVNAGSFRRWNVRVGDRLAVRAS